MDRQAIFRFAPSPNGYLHIGHAYSALLNFNLAQKMQGKFLLRIENIDITRTRQIYIDAIYEDLHWLGIKWAKPVLLQSNRFASYKKAAKKLKKMGLLYPCFCTRKQIEQNSNQSDPDNAPLYNGTCKSLTKDKINIYLQNNIPYQWRLNMQKATEKVSKLYFVAARDENFSKFEQIAIKPQIWGDVILVRKDFATSYHLSVVLDDDYQKITHIVRGKDLEKATHIHRLLQQLLNLSSPIYFHHKIILDNEKNKLSKSKGSVSIRELRKKGIGADKIKKSLALAGNE